MLEQKTKISRRSLFLWIGLLGAASLGGIRFLSGTKRALGHKGKNLSSGQSNILGNIYQVMTGVSRDDKQELSRALIFMDEFLKNLNPRDLFEFKLGLWVWQQSPLIFHGLFTPFTGLSHSDQTRCLEGHLNGAPWRVPLYSGLKGLCFMAYYANDKRFEPLGYDGPWVEKNNRDEEFSREYLALKAPL